MGPSVPYWFKTAAIYQQDNFNIIFCPLKYSFLFSLYTIWPHSFPNLIQSLTIKTRDPSKTFPQNLVMGPGQNFLTQVGSAIFGLGMDLENFL